MEKKRGKYFKAFVLSKKVGFSPSDEDCVLLSKCAILLYLLKPLFTGKVLLWPTLGFVKCSILGAF
jgi:hypothetical protein